MKTSVVLLLTNLICVVDCWLLAVPLVPMQDHENTTEIRGSITFSHKNVDVLRGTTWQIVVTLSPPPPYDVNVTLDNESCDLVELSTNLLQFKANHHEGQTITYTALKPGRTSVFVSSRHDDYRTQDAWVNIAVHLSNDVRTVASVFGWMYFAAWSISFYPQIVQVLAKRSVEGLSLDYVAMNFIGHMSYCFFNAFLFWSSTVHAEYYEIYPRGVIQVQINDVAFSLHATTASVILIFECLVFHNNSNRLSVPGRALVVLYFISGIVLTVLCSIYMITWLTFLYYLSYVKIVLTFGKYSPQVYMNWRRKSTDGWSIHSSLADFVGGVLSILQMFMISYNYNDWGSIFGDPTKFALGFFSLVFDFIFITQHYYIYADRGVINSHNLEITILTEKDKNGLHVDGYRTFAYEK